MTAIVVDASVALAWVLEDTPENHLYAAQVAGAKIGGAARLIAPALLWTECGARLLKVGRARRWGEAKTAEFAETIDLFGIGRFEVEIPSIAALVRFGVRRHVQGYDAQYLALALSTGAQIATLDSGLRTAAKMAGVALYSTAATAP